MYFWKCWRDSRARFLVMLLLGAAVAAGIGQGDHLEWQRQLAAYRGLPPPELVRTFWLAALESMLTLGGFFSLATGVLLGVGGMGEEFERDTAPFLLTRPRRRRHFVWTWALAGSLEILAFACIFVLSAFASLLYLTGHVGAWRVLAPAPVLFVTGLLGFALTQLLTALSHSAKHAFAGSAAAFVCYSVLVAAVWNFTGISLPSPWKMYAIGLDPGVIRVGQTLAWFGVALGLLFLQQLAVERMET